MRIRPLQFRLPKAIVGNDFIRIPETDGKKMSKPNKRFGHLRPIYDEFLRNPRTIDDLLEHAAEIARGVAISMLHRVRPAGDRD